MLEMAENTGRKCALGSVKRHVKTRICGNSYVFKWEIENISLLHKDLHTDYFDPFPECSLSCEIDPFSRVSLVENCPFNICIKGHITVCDSHGKILFYKTFSHTVTSMDDLGISKEEQIAREMFDSVVYPPVVSGYMEEVDLKCLPNDVLVIVCRIYDGSPGTHQQQVSKRAVATPFDYLKKLAIDFSPTLSKEKVYLCVGNESETINKSILRAKSSVFKKMLKKLKPEKHETSLTLEDVDISVVRSLVKFLNSGIVPEHDSDHLLNLYRAANKYDVPELRDACGDQLVSELNLKNVCQILVLSVSHSDDELKKHVIAFLRDNFEMVLMSDEWQFIMREEPIAALEVVAML